MVSKVYENDRGNAKPLSELCVAPAIGKVESATRMIDFQPGQRDDIAIDMTPMIDCVFQLLIFFLLSSSFLAPSVKLQLPRASADPPTAVETVIVTLDAAGRLFVNKAVVSRDSLAEALHGEWAGRKDRTVMLRADRGLPYEKVLDALLAVQRAGSTHVHLAYEDDRRTP
jgi:biopolymer transport protein ExbD